MSNKWNNCRIYVPQGSGTQVTLLFPLSPHFRSVLAELSPANQGRDADPCSVEPDEEESEEGGERGGERELPVLAHHHVPLEGQDGERDDGLDPCQLIISSITELEHCEIQIQ